MTQEIDEMLDFLLYEKGEEITINVAVQVALIIDAADKPTYYDDKIIRVKGQLKTGDMIGYNNVKYLVISQVNKEEKSYKARIRKCSYRIAFNWSGNIKWFDCIEESSFFDVSTGTIISTATGNIFVTLPYNSDTRAISLSQRFYVTNQPFKVVGIDKSQEGLIKLNCALDTIIQTDDDVENNIADRWKYEVAHTYALTIINGDAANVLINDVMQLNVTATDNGTSITNPAVTFASNNPEIVSVDNSGKVMGIELGQATVTAKLTYHNTISDTITVTSVETETHNYSISISGSSTIMSGVKKSFVSHIYDNGSEVTDKSVVWSIRNQDGTTSMAYATITASTGTSVTVKADLSISCVGKYVVLKATLSDDATVFSEHIIEIIDI
ncbi:MAG: Ig-like domain-containing protein [Eubacteriales bacterium]|nr:Ig-like domain-containing protein [Eubacteriales bacterium]